MTQLKEVAQALDELLRTSEVPDYPNSLNGIQITHRGPVRGIAAAVDVSITTIRGAIAADANLLIVHHGLFWGGQQPIVGAVYDRLRLLLDNDLALYASHLPLDAHPRHGNNALLAAALGLTPQGGFARFRGTTIGLMGESSIDTTELVERARSVVQPHSTVLRTTSIPGGHRTRRWGMCSGAGASADTLKEAIELGLDTLIVGEGPHWTAVDAPDHDLVIIYAGHYATETFGIQSVAKWAAERFHLPWSFIDAPTGL